jgi:hypothetical protein
MAPMESVFTSSIPQKSDSIQNLHADGGVHANLKKAETREIGVKHTQS